MFRLSLAKRIEPDESPRTIIFKLKNKKSRYIKQNLLWLWNYKKSITLIHLKDIGWHAQIVGKEILRTQNINKDPLKIKKKKKTFHGMGIP